MADAGWLAGGFGQYGSVSFSKGCYVGHFDQISGPNFLRSPLCWWSVAWNAETNANMSVFINRFCYVPRLTWWGWSRAVRIGIVRKGVLRGAGVHCRWLVGEFGPHQSPSARLLRIVAGVLPAPSFSTDLVGLWQYGSVSFEKWCYVGQELTARTHFRGQVRPETPRIS
jgi:folate-binding protein YgfZ